MISKEEIKQLRQNLGWSQQKFADYLGVSKETVNRWENGHRVPLPIFRTKLDALQSKQPKE
jgi:DNA-binding transcriptional regulator YiaG